MKKWLSILFFLIVMPIMAESTPTPSPLLPGKWIAANVPWDLWFKKNPSLILMLCGSASSWIEKNILSNIGARLFFGSY